MNKRIKRKKGMYKCPCCGKQMEYVYDQFGKRTKRFCWDVFTVEFTEKDMHLVIEDNHSDYKVPWR